MTSYLKCGCQYLEKSTVGGYYGHMMTAGSPQVKPVPQSYTGSVGMSTRVSRIGMCYYHPDLPAVYVCNRCGRPICRDCAKAYVGLMLCPQCYSMSVPRFSPVYPPFVTYQ